MPILRMPRSMKIKLLLILLVLPVFLSSQCAFAAETGDAAAELKALVTKIQTKLQAGKRTEKDLTEDLKEFDVLLAKHKDEKTDEVANILYMEAMLYLQVLDNTEKGVALMQQVKRDFPETKRGKSGGD